MNAVKSWAHRVLKQLARYTDLATGEVDAPSCTDGLQLQAGETCLGVYQSQPSEPSEKIVVTDRGLHVHGHRNDRWDFIAYDRVRSIDAPAKQDCRQGVMLHLADGRAVALPVQGGEGPYCDAFEFVRFLDRVTASSSREAKHARL